MNFSLRHTQATVKHHGWWIILALATFVPRLTKLGTVLTVDEPLWLSRGATFIQGLSVGNFSKTLVAGQPGVTTSWLTGLASPWHSLAAGQAAIAITTGLLILISTYFLSLLIGRRLALITGSFIALDPFLLGHSRVAHTDALLALFYLASLLALLVAWQDQGNKETKPILRYSIMSAALAAGAILTKIFGLILIPTSLVYMAYKSWQSNISASTATKKIITWIALTIIMIFISWPALWVSADKVYTYLFSRASLHAEGTRSEQTTSANWYYLREELFRLSIPVTLLLPFAVIAFYRQPKSAHARVTAGLVLSGLAYAAILSVGSDKSDRYILFTHVTLITAAPLGLAFLYELVKKAGASKTIASLVLLAAPLYLAIDDMRLNPYYLAHYNLLYPIEAQHKLGWGEGLEQAAAWIESQDPTAKVLTYYPRVFQEFYPGEIETITHVNDANSDYVVVYRSMFERGSDTPEAEIVAEFINSGKHTPVHIVTINGLPYAWIFATHQ